MKHAAVIRILAVAWMAGLMAAVGNIAQADPIGPGYDLFQTNPMPVDLGEIGTVPMKGWPIGIGNTNIIIERTQGIDPFDPPNGIGTVPIELVALSLKSVMPVNISDSFFDLFLTINSLSLPGLPQPDTLAPSLGMMTIRHQNPGGGTFDSFFDVFADLIVTVPGGDPNHPVFSQAATMGSPVSTSGEWSHTAPPLYPFDPRFPSGGLFVTSLGEGSLVVPAEVVPEPATLLLVGSGLAGLAAWRRRSCRRHPSRVGEIEVAAKRVGEELG